MVPVKALAPAAANFEMVLGAHAAPRRRDVSGEVATVIYSSEAEIALDLRR